MGLPVGCAIDAWSAGLIFACNYSLKTLYKSLYSEEGYPSDRWGIRFFFIIFLNIRFTIFENGKNMFCYIVNI